MLVSQPRGTDRAAPLEDRAAKMVQKVQHRLRSNPYGALKHVVCNLDGGCLVLHGCLLSYYLKQVAQRVAAGVDGVGQIVNRIAVVPRSVGRD